MEVVFREGLLFLQVVKFGKKTWRKTWMSLYKASSMGVGRLELYTVVDNTGAGGEQKKSHKARNVVRLRDCLSVTAAPKESCPPDCEAFYLNTTSTTYTLASAATQDWISALCILAFQQDPEDADKGAFDRGNNLIIEDNDLYSSWESDTMEPPKAHIVSVRLTEASRRCNLSGDYLISPEEDALLLLHSETQDVIYHWPYKMLRKYGQVEGGFSIEAGRRSESGAGRFVFLSKQAKHIFQTLSQQCTKKTRPSQQHNNQARFDQSTVHSPITADPSCPRDLLSAHTDDGSLNYCGNLTDCLRQLSVDPAHCGPSGEAAKERGEDDPGHSLETQDLCDVSKESIYYNLPRSVSDQMNEHFTDDSESLYSHVDKHKTSLWQSTMTTEEQPAGYPILKPRYSRQQAKSEPLHPLCATQTPVIDHVVETEGIISTGQITPSEAPASFKNRLAEIISKDLAKFQAPVSPGQGSPTYSL